MKGEYSVKSSETSPPLLVKASEKVRQLFDKDGDTRLVFHHYPLAAEVAQCVVTLCQEEQADTTVQMVSGLAGWFAVTGYLSVYANPYAQSIRMAGAFLDKQSTSKEIKERTLACLETLGNDRRPETQEGRIVVDAINMATYVHLYPERQQLLRLEREFMLDQCFDKQAWAKEQLEELLKVRFYTPFGQVDYAPKLAQHILLQKLQLEKQQKNTDRDPAVLSNPGHFQQLEDQIPIRSIQTFFRTNYRNHINLSAIADNKANIMISVNTILISVLITALSYQHIAEKNPMVIMPVVIFLVTGLASLTFAILSARPKVTVLNDQKIAPAEARKNIIFFGNFVSLNLDQYEEAMDAMFRDGELLIGNMTRDLYYLGKVLDKKYRFLSISYNIFMVGFVATVVTFLWTLF
ncbi:MAG: hypothetical protein DHS20C18_41380 [Saprospiraceae bacterium]|nr:MAG: hypothetical protein DHS20C18_41380 [Saprospiraceae bacterium]